MPTSLRPTILVTGAGFRRVGPREGTELSRKNVKLNIGACTAAKLLREGENVAIVGRREEIVDQLASWLRAEGPGRLVACAALDITDELAISKFVREIPTDHGIFLVQAVGLSSGNYLLPADNPYKLITEVNPNTIIEETRVPVLALINSIRALLPIWEPMEVRKKAIIVNSMSGIRAYPRGSSHATAKGALHQTIRSLSLELYTRKIFLTEINPGIVDTGLYDSDEVQDAVRDLAAAFGQDLSDKSLPAMSSEDVADTIALALRSAAHILQINLVASGQFPHLGA